MEAQDWGRRIRAFRKFRGFTQEKLARKLGIPIAELGRIERGYEMPSIEMLKRCSVILNITVTEMMPKDFKDS